MRSTIGATFGAVALFGVITSAIEVTQSLIFPASYGENYLRSQGYENISGGGRDIFNACGEGVYARHYHISQPELSEFGEDITVCFNPFIGRHLSLLG